MGGNPHPNPKGMVMPRKKKVKSEEVVNIQESFDTQIIEGKPVEVVSVNEEVKEIKESKYKAEDVVVCTHCGSKTFYNQGKCKWCYKNLEGSELVK